MPARQLSNRKKPPDRSRLWLLPARFFLVKLPINHTRSLAQAHSFGTSATPIPPRRVQKTFSAGPCSFNSRELWFRKSSSATFTVQPFSDSRHGRITGKLSRSCVTLNSRKAAVSNQTKGLVVQPLCWLAATLQNSNSSSSPVPGTFVSHHNRMLAP